MVKHKGDENFVYKLYKKFVKVPKVVDSEWPEHEQANQIIKTANESLMICIDKLIYNYLSTAQHLYELVPLVVCLGDDPYLSSFVEGKKFLEKYFSLQREIHNELVKRAIIKTINHHLPRNSEE